MLSQQRDVAVGVTGQEQHLERLAGEIEGVALVDEVRRLDGRDRQLVLGLRGARGVLARHPVPKHPALEAVAGVAIEPRAHGQLAIDAPLHDLLRARDLRQAGARADVVGVVVRDHHAPDVRVPEQRECLLPAPAGSRRAEAAVDQRPALGVVDRVAVHVVERPRQRLRDAMHAIAEVLHLELAPRADAQGAVRPWATNAACVTGMACSKCGSAASA